MTCVFVQFRCTPGRTYAVATAIYDREAVSELYAHIQKDPRHKEVVLLHYEEISERRFSGWTMGQVDVTRVNTRILLKYSERAELDPYSVSGKVSLALLEELMATASIVGRS
jgi:hypothetical protein